MMKLALVSISLIALIGLSADAQQQEDAVAP